jgi:preprotein translocase subunit SecF
MIRIFANAAYDFLAVRRWAYVITGVFVLPGLMMLGIRGLNESIEFTGGTLIQVHARDTTMRTATIRSALQTVGLNPEIQTFGAPNEFVIRARIEGATDTGTSTQETRALVEQGLDATFGPEAYEIVRTEAVGPKVGSELRQKALLAILLSFGATLIYLWFRFEWRFGVAAIVATAHDILATVALIGWLDLEVSLVIVAAALTIVGYSLNDTIVVFDRVRENLRKFKRENIYQILNRSVNETLPRTLLTGLSTITATIALLVFGGGVIRGFALVMTFGIVVGTFSSIYIASPVLLAIEQRWPGEDVKGAKTIVARGAPAT